MLLTFGKRMTRQTRCLSARLPLANAPLIIMAFMCLTGFDLTRHSVSPGQILNGGPPKDGIPAILDPKFVSASTATFLMPDDRVIGVFVHAKAKAYPLKILNWHEVVDDSVGGKPLAVTFCPLTQSAIVYDRKLGNKTLRLAVSGKLYESNLLFYDKATESLWSQIKGQAVAGPLTGRRLEPLPGIVTTWADWRAAHPDTLVLDINTGYSRNYGIDPYQGYESSDEVMFPVSPTDDRLPAKERVLGLTINGVDEVFPFSRLAAARMPLQVAIGGEPVTVIFDARSLTAGAVVRGKHVPAYTGYWFGWAAFHPDAAIWNETGIEKSRRPPPAEKRGTATSDIYGSSGTASPFGKNKMGVVGECLWIHDILSRRQLASDDCSNENPGKFRIQLKPGKYVVRGPGGDKRVEIKSAQWTRVDSVAEIPLGSRSCPVS